MYVLSMYWDGRRDSLSAELDLEPTPLQPPDNFCCQYLYKRAYEKSGLRIYPMQDPEKNSHPSECSFNLNPGQMDFQYWRRSSSLLSFSESCTTLTLYLDRRLVKIMKSILIIVVVVVMMMIVGILYHNQKITI